MSIGQKGMMVAAKTLTLTAIEILENPNLVQKSTEEFIQRRGADFKSQALVGDRDPPLDYSK